MFKSLVMAGVVLLGAAGLEAAPEESPIPFRGVVEGYYGRPWGTEGRLSLLKFMGEHGMNVFIYGPKDDPYHHSKWREPYPKADMKDFAKLLKVAKENKILFTWAIHLGGTFEKGKAADYDALFKKLNWMYDGGFRAFAVFFDDFGSSDAAFHAEICNRIVNEFLEKKGDCAPLVMCPNVYWGTGNPYQRTLGEKLDKRVNIMWTGKSICTEVKAEDVKKITEDFRRAPYIWWNWPVNDYCRTKLLLGRTYGLDEGTYAGFVTNPMENCEANKIALYSVAEWCRDPKAFDSQKSWENAFKVLYKNPAIAKAMRIFAEHNSDPGVNGHGFRREESVSAAPLCAKAREEYKATATLTPETSTALKELFTQVGEASNFLRKKLPKSRYQLGWELEGWLEAEELQMATGLRTLEYLAADTPAKKRKVLDQIRKIRKLALKSGERHRDKFASATFAGDLKYIKAPLASTTELKPTIEMMLGGELRKAYKAKFGKDFDAADGLVAFSETASLKNLVASRDARNAGLVRVMELKDVKPGESFGIRVPDAWETDYFHAKLGEPAAVKAGVIELSKDGKRWTKLDTDNSGEEMQKRLSVKDNWRWARYRNTSKKTIQLKINLFKFDVIAPKTAVDEMLEALE